MRAFSTLLAAAALARTVAAADINGLLTTLSARNLTSLVGAATVIANTTAGQHLLGLLSGSTPLTLLAPNNDVRTSCPSNSTQLE